MYYCYSEATIQRQMFPIRQHMNMILCLYDNILGFNVKSFKIWFQKSGTEGLNSTDRLRYDWWTHSAPRVIWSPRLTLHLRVHLCSWTQVCVWSDTDRFLSTALRLMLTAPVHVASAESTFTRLKHVLTVRRAARDCQLLSRYALNMNLWDLWTRMNVQSQLLQQSVIGNPTS